MIVTYFKKQAFDAYEDLNKRICICIEENLS